MKVRGKVTESDQSKAWGLVVGNDGEVYPYLIESQSERLMVGDHVSFDVRKTSESGLIAERLERTGAACQVS